MSNNIDKILEKYWAGESTLEEEAMLHGHFKASSNKSDEDLAMLFNAYSSESKHTSTYTFPSNIEDLYIESLLQKFWDCETELIEEAELKQYFNSKDVSAHLQQYQPFFQTLSQQSSISGKELNLDLSADKTERKAKTRRMIIPRKWVAIAASFLLAAVVWFNSDEILNPPRDSGSVYASMTAEEKETYDLTMEALAFMSGKLDKGSSAIKNDFTKVANANIFNTAN